MTYSDYALIHQYATIINHCYVLARDGRWLDFAQLDAEKRKLEKELVRRFGPTGGPARWATLGTRRKLHDMRSYFGDFTASQLFNALDTVRWQILRLLERRLTLVGPLMVMRAIYAELYRREYEPPVIQAATVRAAVRRAAAPQPARARA